MPIPCLGTLLGTRLSTYNAIRLGLTCGLRQSLLGVIVLDLYEGAISKGYRPLAFDTIEIREVRKGNTLRFRLSDDRRCGVGRHSDDRDLEEIDFGIVASALGEFLPGLRDEPDGQGIEKLVVNEVSHLAPKIRLRELDVDLYSLTLDDLAVNSLPHR